MRKIYISIAFFCILLALVLFTRAPLLLFILVIYTIIAVAVNKHDANPSKQSAGALSIGFTIAGVFILILAVGAFVMAGIFHERNPHGWLNDIMPQLHEDFEIAQPMLESLRGEFGQRSTIAWPCDTSGWRLSYQIAPPAFGISGEWVRVNYDDWHTLDWLCHEAAVAIVHLTSPQKMNYPFESIIARAGHGDERHSIQVRLEFFQHESELVIFNAPEYDGHTRFIVYHEYLDSGYELILLRRMIYPTVVRIFLVIGAVLLAFAVLMLALGRTYRPTRLHTHDVEKS